MKFQEKNEKKERNERIFVSKSFSSGILWDLKIEMLLIY